MSKIIKFSGELVITNTAQLARGKGLRYLEVLEDDLHNVLIAKQWRVKPNPKIVGQVLVDFK